jgi:hypothetical protein
MHLPLDPRQLTLALHRGHGQPEADDDERGEQDALDGLPH